MIDAQNQFVRLKEVQKYLRLNNTEFAKVIGFNTSNSFTNLSSKGRRISMDVVVSLFSNHPDINIHWLLTGIGNMLISDDVNKTVTSSPTPSDKELELIKRIEKLEQVQTMILKSLNENIK